MRRLVRSPLLAGALLVALARAAAAAPAPERGRLEIDAAETVVAFRLGGRLHDTHGRFRRIAGEIAFDRATGRASGRVVVDAASGDSGNGARDARMREVLRADAHPEIAFAPRAIDGSIDGDGRFRAQLRGTLSLAGAEHAIDLPVEGNVAGERVQAIARLTIPYVAWGLEDPSVLFLSVSPEVEVEIQLVARLVAAPPQEP